MADTYDVRGNLTSETDPASGTDTFTYDSQDDLLSETDPLGHTSTNTYDSTRCGVDPTGDVLGCEAFPPCPQGHTTPPPPPVGVVTDAALDLADVLPAASKASTVYE